MHTTEPVLAEATASHEPRKATPFQLVFMTYAVICSGAYGLESMISTSGPGIALLVLAGLPLIYALPLALTCAELSARHPVEGGYYRWVRMAFGDGVGYTSGWLIWLATFATNASFAVLFGSYLRNFVPDHPIAPLAATIAVIWIAVYLNYLGIRLVGAASVIATILILLPFAIMTVMGLLRWRYVPTQPFVNPDETFGSALFGGVLIAMWLYGGFEKLTVVAEEVEAPRRAFPLAIAIALPLCMASYLVPTIAALAANGDWREWGDAHFVTSAAKIGGPWLGAMMAAGALVSNASLLMVTMLSQSRLPMVLADDGLFPEIFRRRHPRFQTPVLSLIVSGIVLTGLATLSFAQLVAAAALVQSLSYVLLYAALFKLRRHADGREPEGFRIPVGTAGLALLVAPSVLIVVLVIRQGLFPDGALDSRQALLDLAIVGSGPLTYMLVHRRATRAGRAVLRG